MRFVQWNTHHGGKRSDGILDIAGISKWLVKFAPDAVSLNELEQNDGYGNTDQLERHRTALQDAQGIPWYSAFGPLNGGSVNKGIGVGLLANKPFIVPPKNHGLYGGRAMLAGSTVGATLYSIHTDSESQAKRVVETTQALCLQQLILGQTIFAGDFNAVPTALEMLSIPQFYKDAWVEAKKIGKATSFTTDGATKSHRIDYVWYFGLSIVAADVPDTSTNGVFPSDHHPIVVDFK
jgi:endonuclease/exonuclease/phosphatase family metal-dependent hydrolase